jgi:uncharacterized DUF497 family protein
MALGFEWDQYKARANLAKHQVSFEEALTVFADPLARIFDDEEHSTVERRELIIGHSIDRRMIVVCFTTCGTRIRLFSARKATPVERKDYEENVSL